MKANELVIGDYVQGFSPGTKLKVCRILNEYRVGIRSYDGIYWELPADDIQPIPLTPKILEKNFPNAESGVIWWWDIDELYCEIDANNGIKVTGYFHNIHELQHALRLCGIEKEIEL